MIANIARWKIQYDPEATRICYSQIAQGSPADCNCTGCKNFASAFDYAYPPEAKAIFDLLGIDFHKAAEVYRNGRLESGLHHYGGWFHLVGSIESGEEAWQVIGDSSTSFRFHPEVLASHFSFGFSSRLALVRESFLDQSLLQLEFVTEIPWVVAEPEPS